MFIPQQLKTKTKNTSLKHKKQKGIVEMKMELKRRKQSACIHIDEESVY